MKLTATFWVNIKHNSENIGKALVKCSQDEDRFSHEILYTDPHNIIPRAEPYLGWMADNGYLKEMAENHF